MLALIHLIIPASATPVVCEGASCEGQPAKGITIVTERAKVDAATLQIIPLDELRNQAPILLAGGEAEGCDAPSPTGGAQMALDSAEGALLYGRFDEASAGVRNARQAVLCASTPVSNATIARIELVAGLIAEEQGDEATAKARYAAAIGYDPGVPWPSSYPAERRALFDAAHGAPTATTTLSVRPMLPEATLDGAPIAASVRTGEHIVRIGQTAVRISLDEVPNRLIVPSAYPDDALSWAGDDTRRAELSALLVAALGEGTEAFIVHGNDAWRAIAGRTDWASFPGPVSVPVPTPQPEIPEPRRRKPGVGIAAAAAGSAVALVGIGMGTAGTLSVNRAIEGASRTDITREEYDSYSAPYEKGRKLASNGWRTTAIGAGVAGLGVVLWVAL